MNKRRLDEGACASCQRVCATIVAAIRLLAARAPSLTIAFMQYIATMQHMPSRLVANVKEIRDDGSVVAIVIWQLDAPVPPCTHA